MGAWWQEAKTVVRASAVFLLLLACKTPSCNICRNGCLDPEPAASAAASQLRSAAQGCEDFEGLGDACLDQARPIVTSSDELGCSAETRGFVSCLAREGRHADAEVCEDEEAVWRWCMYGISL